jgi:hypothetical protein
LTFLGGLLVENAGSIAVQSPGGGTITLGSGTSLSIAGQYSNSATFTGGVVGDVNITSTGSLMAGGFVAASAAPQMAITGNLTNAGWLYNLFSISGGNTTVNGSLTVLNGMVSNSATGFIINSGSMKGTAVGAPAATSTINFAVLGSGADFYNAGTVVVFAQSGTTNQTVVSALTVDGIFTNLGTLDLRAQATTSNNGTATVLFTAGRLFLADGSTFKGTATSTPNYTTTITLTGAGNASQPVFANRISAGPGAGSFSPGSATWVVTGPASSFNAPAYLEVNSTLSSLGADQFEIQNIIFNGSNSYFRLVPGSQTSATPSSSDALFFIRGGTLMSTNYLDLNRVTLRITGGTFTIDSNATLADHITLSGHVGQVEFGVDGNLQNNGFLENVNIPAVGSTLTNTGTIQALSGQNTSINFTSIKNTPTGIIIAHSGGSIGSVFSGMFTNAGTIWAAGANSTITITFVSAPPNNQNLFTNQGKIVADAGKISINVSGAGGLMNTFANQGSVIATNAGSVVLTVASDMTAVQFGNTASIAAIGAGSQFRFVGGTLELRNGRLEADGGLASITGDLFANSGSLLIDNGGAVSITGNLLATGGTLLVRTGSTLSVGGILTNRASMKNSSGTTGVATVTAVVANDDGSISADVIGNSLVFRAPNKTLL